MLVDIGYEVQSDALCPFKTFTVKGKEKEIYEFCKANGLHFILNNDSLLINLNVTLLNDTQRYDKIENILRNAYKKVIAA